jgi:hypothetical protein
MITDTIWGAKVMARYIAKRAIEEGLRSKGVRVTLVRPAEINAQVNAYLAQHPELYVEARKRLERLETRRR